ncbi:MAG: hypothetical protein KAR20_27895, partial [Candidatus Heimdallarchaeota archaeon]|nr:hypothetical protein [Candidatus Heimdallarchaeota archaeon]
VNYSQEITKISGIFATISLLQTFKELYLFSGNPGSISLNRTAKIQPFFNSAKYFFQIKEEKYV